MKIGIITSPDRLAVFEKSFERTPDVEIVGETSVAPDWRAVLASWDNLNFDVAVIDDACANDKAAMQAAIRYFQAAPRPPAAHMRIVFFAAPERSAQDPLYSMLATDGVYDMVLPFRDKSPLGKLVSLIEYPAKRNDVLTLLSATSPVAVTDPAAVPPPLSAPLTTEERTRFMARGQSVVAVAGIMPRAGASLASIAIARSLVMLGQVPALVVDKLAYAAYQSCYPAAVAEDGQSYKVNGVTIFCGTSPSVVPRRYTHIVLDLGYIGWGLEASTVEGQQAVIEFGRADLQVVYVTCTNPMERGWLKRFMASQTPADINRYAIGIWGTTPDLYADLSASIKQQAPDAYIWAMPPLAWPLALAEIPDGVCGALAPVLPRSAVQGEEPARAQAGAGGMLRRIVSGRGRS